MSVPAPYSGLAAVYDEVVAGVPYDTWAAFCRTAWGAGVERVLDVCCGSGRLTAELVALGYDVTGVDGSAAMLERARALLGPEVALSRQVLPDLSVEGIFDAAVSSFDSLNYLRPEELPRVFTAVADILRPGGRFVFDLHTEAMMRTIAAAPRSDTVSDGVRFAMTSEVDLAARTAETRVEVTAPDGDRFDETHRQYFFRDDDVRATLRNAGLELVGIHDDYTSAPADASSMRATWVARRP